MIRLRNSSEWTIKEDEDLLMASRKTVLEGLKYRKQTESVTKIKEDESLQTVTLQEVSFWKIAEIIKLKTYEDRGLPIITRKMIQG